jgi:hypothetical protein
MLSNALLIRKATADLRPLIARRAVAIRPSERLAHAPDLAPDAARDLVRAIAAGAVVLTVVLSVTDALQLAFLPGQGGDVRAGILAVALAIPLHVRHLIYGVRGERPPAGAWTLAVLAVVTAAGAYLGGDVWSREFTLLAVSILIVVPGRWAVVGATAVALAPLVLVGTQWYSDDVPLPGVYFAFVIAWRSATQFIALRLLAALRALDSASKELEMRAVVQTRVRIDSELRKGVGAVLHQIVARGETARAAATADPASALAELTHLVSECRRGHADARRVAASYRGRSLRAELDAAAALLEASGARVRIVAEGVSLDSPDPGSRVVIRTAISGVLLDEPRSNYRMDVTRDRAGALRVRVSLDEGESDAAREMT